VGSDKIKPLTLLSQPKLALTAINTLLQYKIQSCGSGMFILDPRSQILIFTHPGSWISDPGSRIHKFPKIENYFSFEMLKKKFGPISKEVKHFLPKKLSLSSQKYVFWILDPESGN
jgi:hypothetical protein